MALTALGKRTLAGLQRTLLKFKTGGAKRAGQIISFAFTRNKQGNYHHIYKQGTQLVSQDKVIGKVKKGQRFLQAEHGLALVKSITKDPYAKFLKGGKIKASALPAIAKKIASQKVKTYYKSYVSKPVNRQARNAHQKVYRARINRIHANN